MSEQHPLDWQAIVHRDPYLAGSIAARSYEWWDEATAASEAESVGLTGEARTAFIVGWNAEIADRRAERDPQRTLFQEYEEMGKDYIKGDPAR